MSSRDRLPVHVFQSAPELIVDIVVAQAIEQLPVLHGDERLIHPFVAPPHRHAERPEPARRDELAAGDVPERHAGVEVGACASRIPNSLAESRIEATLRGA